MPETTAQTRWPALMSTATLAAYLDVSERTVEQWRTCGKLPAPVEMNGARLTRWRKSDIDEFLGAMPAETK